MTTATTQIRYRLHPQAAHRKVGGEVFVVTGDRAFHRLHTATAIELFDALAITDDGVSAEELTALLRRDYDVSDALAQKDVAEFLDLLLSRQLAVPATSVPSRDSDAPADPQAKVTP